MQRARSGIIILCLTISWFAVSSVHAQWITVDLCTFPGTGLPVAEWTVLDDQWRPIGILFDADPPTVDPIMRDWGECYLFFNPDQYGVSAVFSFVEPNTSVSTNASGFTLNAYYNPGESAQLVGLDSFDNVIAQDQITPGDIGSGSQTLGMTIIGSFHTVEWRTQGNPGIAANGIEFALQAGPAIPTLAGLAVLVFSILLALGAVLILRR
ncbi:MAG: hypothetical protein K8R59_06550 [Thermoanaerobaculales bacterium]|nr:hypothetical protein [Thermoanaerobaculales bacterium]